MKYNLTMNEDYLYEDEKYAKIVDLLKKIDSSLAYTAPEARENKYYLLAEKYSNYFNFENREYFCEDCLDFTDQIETTVRMAENIYPMIQCDV